MDCWDSAIHDDDEVLIEKEFVDYFRNLASEGVPIVLSIRVKDLYGSCEEYEDEKQFPWSAWPTIIAKSFLLEQFSGLRFFLGIVLNKHPTHRFEMRATIQAYGLEHKEKVHGYCAISSQN